MSISLAELANENNSRAPLFLINGDVEYFITPPPPPLTLNLDPGQAVFLFRDKTRQKKRV